MTTKLCVICRAEIPMLGPQLCPECQEEPLRQWQHLLSDGRRVAYASRVTAECAWWCEAHQWASSEACDICAKLGPVRPPANQEPLQWEQQEMPA